MRFKINPIYCKPGTRRPICPTCGKPMDVAAIKKEASPLLELDQVFVGYCPGAVAGRCEFYVCGPEVKNISEAIIDLQNAIAFYIAGLKDVREL